MVQIYKGKKIQRKINRLFEYSLLFAFQTSYTLAFKKQNLI